MDKLKKNLEHREKAEFIAIIQHMLRQEPELQWLLITALPTASARKSSVDPEVYRQQVLAAMSVGENLRKRGEVQRRLTAIKTIADEFVTLENYAAALTIYEVLVTEVIAHFQELIAAGL
jgi:tartrate dehydratase beta subunit/fumarate hydratase class I family protein